MSLSQSPSGWFRRLSPRERRVVSGGALVVSLTLLGAWVVLPLVRRWDDRETAIQARQTQLSQLKALVRSEATRRRDVAALQRDRLALRRQLLTGATPALAASNLQALLQGYADASRVTLDRVDLVAEPGSSAEGGLPAIPVQLSASGDIYGLAELLARLQYGGTLLVIDEVRVSTGDIEGEDSHLLAWSVRLHGAYSPE